MALPFTDEERDFVAGALRRGNVFDLISALQLLIAEGADMNAALSGVGLPPAPIAPPAQIAQTQTPQELVRDVMQKLSEAIGIRGDLRQVADNMPLLTLFRQVMTEPVQLQQALDRDSTPADLQDRFGAWLFNFETIQNVLNQSLQTGGGQLGALATQVLRQLHEANFTNETFFAAFQVPAADIPVLPTDPNAAFPQPPTGGGTNVVVNVGGPSGDFPGSKTTVTESLRPPTGEEFLNDFDNALLTFLGTSIEGLSAIQLDAIRDRRNELLADYIVRLSEFAERGISPFRGDTRVGDVVSTSVTDPAVEGEPLETNVVRRGVSSPADIGIGFLTAFVTPTDFLAEKFPTTSSLKQFVLGPSGESSLPSSGFVGSTAFQRSF